MVRFQPPPPRLGKAWRRGLLADLVGALFVTVLGTGTIAMTLKSAWLRNWLYHGQHLGAAVSYSDELTASSDAATYLLICLAFPVIGLALGVFGGMEESGTEQSGPPRAEAAARPTPVRPAAGACPMPPPRRPCCSSTAWTLTTGRPRQTWSAPPAFTPGPRRNDRSW
jgi:hypothetical protein